MGQLPFDEQLPACEDKEWGLRVLAAGWTIAIDPELSVSDGHRRQDGLGRLYSRTRREFAAIGSFTSVPPFTITELLRQWLTDIPAHAPYHGWRRRLNYFRFAELVGEYHGLKDRGAATPSITRELTPESPLHQTHGTTDGI